MENFPLKLMIVGHARHGKDTVADFIKELYGVRFTSSSWFCAERVLMPAFLREAKKEKIEFPYGSAQECFDDRHNHREFWHQEIAKYATPDLTRLTREIFRANDMYVGCRNYRELMACRSAGCYDYAIWVDRIQHVKPEPETSMNIPAWMADYWVDNNGSLQQTRLNVAELMSTLLRKGPQRRVRY